VDVPTGPGLGVEVNEEAIRRYPFVPAAAKPFVLT
jgi:L-alanine-DL-glutamate epimerase-like enolase superfamily enzyme